MKKIAVLLVCLFIVSTSFAQFNDDFEDHGDNGDIKTLFSNDKSIGGYGGFSVKYNEIDGKDGMTIGGRLGFVFNHSVAFGLDGCGFMNESEYNPVLDDEYNLSGGYGGIFVEPIIGAKFPIHVSVPMLFGAGGVTYSKNFYDDWDEWDDEFDQANVEDNDAFFVFEPGVELELNLIKFIRLSFGAYYRLTSNVKLESDMGDRLVKEDVLNGLSYGVSVKFGKF